MTLQQEFKSWLSPSTVETFSPPEVGGIAPSLPQLQFPDREGKPVILTFLRHCGCPFAEKTFQTLRKTAEANPNIKCIAVSHSDKSSTGKWVEAVGGAGLVEVVVDSDRLTYGKWGLGISSFWHVLNPWSMKNVVTLGRRDGIWNRPTESGSRWQTAGSFAVDKQGIVRYVQIANAADEMGDFEGALNSLR